MSVFCHQTISSWKQGCCSQRGTSPTTVNESISQYQRSNLISLSLGLLINKWNKHSLQVMRLFKSLVETRNIQHRGCWAMAQLMPVLLFYYYLPLSTAWLLLLFCCCDYYYHCYCLYHNEEWYYLQQSLIELSLGIRPLARQWEFGGEWNSHPPCGVYSVVCTQHGK